ncbi:hypothetical protein ACSBR1_026826 [Camellia fascicularis]
MAMVVYDALISTIGGKVVELLVEPAGRQFDYIFSRVKYIENLREQVQNLEAQRKDVLDSIDATKKNREEILESVKNWIDKVNGFILKAKEFLEGKAAKNKAEEAKELGKEGTFNNNISKLAPPLGIESISSEQLAPYASSNLTMTNVMEALIDDKISFIGLHGIGGVGKTTLVKEIAKKAKSDKLFNEVVMAIVSQDKDNKKIQDDIAGMLGFTNLINQPSEIERASMLRARLKDVKKILVILDDVWAELADVGIPFGNDHQGCKIIITTRREQVCSSMGMERERIKIVHLDVLSEEDSWDLFRKNAGNVVDSNVVNAIANEVCKECGGLPIALVTVGIAMKNKDDPNSWNQAAQELRKSMPTNIEDVNQRVYKSLKFSYDYLSKDNDLRGEEAKACFLLCSLFPEDHNILIEDLVQYGMGLRVFKKVDTVREARGRAKSVIKNLIDSCLLLAGDKQDCIKMHDVVRDVAIDIGSEKYFVRAGCNLNDWPKIYNLDQYIGISLMRNQISNLPEACLLSEAPNAIRELTNLRLLDMTESHHEFLIPAAMVLPLSHLEELYLFDITSSSIGYPAGEVVVVLRSLPRLKLLTISIPDIAYIPKDFVFPELDSFIILIGKSRTWLSVENDSPNHLELGNLIGPMVNWSKWLKMVLKRATHLRIKDCRQFEYLINTEEWGISSQAQPRDLQLLFNLEELVLRHLDSFKGIYATSAVTTSSWVCFPKLRSLGVSFCPELSIVLPFNLLQRLQHLEKLEVVGCKKLEQVFDFGSEREGIKLLSSLRILDLIDLPRLKHLLNCSSRQHVQLSNLRYLYVFSCGKLKYVFQPSIAQALHQLEELSVYMCEEMEEIVATKQNERHDEEERVDYKMVFKSLKKLHLMGLPNLSGFCTG